MWVLLLAILIGCSLALFYLGRTLLAWLAPTLLALVGLVAWRVAGPGSPLAAGLLLALFVIVSVVLGIRPLRRALITPVIFRKVAPLLPRMSSTERIALEAGTVWWDGELFSGRPDWQKLLDVGFPQLTERERAFVDGPCEEVCRMVNDWEVSRAGDLPPPVWDYLKSRRFFGMIIPEQYGGLGFSAEAHSAVIMKLASRSAALAVTAMVPNSLGPAELLLHYGTDEQKATYLPRLADGREVPCFALTEPWAGSDAGSLRSRGVVCRGTHEGREVIGIRLNWEKRYITLGPVATVLGLAFVLHDPDGLLGGEKTLGITVALVPTSLPGIEHEDRHDPLGVAFMNGPTRGRDVFIPIDFIVGGPRMAGNGWMMLMQCLAAGRGISLPSLSAGTGKLATRGVGAYVTVREQFGMPIGAFGGVEEYVARVAGLTYMIDAARRLTARAVDLGEKPAVISAIVKRYTTEAARGLINDAMDVFGGSGISRGPRNVIAKSYEQVPIGVTVEGANILTRTMIIFGQGAIRCHPYVRHEMDAAARNDLAAFDRGFFGHVGYVFSNAARSLILGLTAGRLVRPPVAGPMAPVFGRLSRLSSAFALAADVAMGTLGGALKRQEKLNGRLADALAWLYLASAAVKRFIADGQPASDRPYAMWVADTALFEIERALAGFLDNLPNRVAAAAVRPLMFPLGRRHRGPSDRLGARVAQGIMAGGEARARLTGGMYVPPPTEPGLGRLEDALQKLIAAAPVHVKLRHAVKDRKLPARPVETILDRAREAGVISEDEHRVASAAEAARDEAMTVDAFKQLAQVLASA